ncbi:hypothetical protein KJ966_07385 [bacterium]|nr:hypothetical protein [bacterium]
MTGVSLYSQLAEHIGHAHSRYIPQIFEILANEKEAILLLAAKAPASATVLSKNTGFHETEINEMIKKLFYKGLIYKSKKTDGIKYYCVRNVIQFHDATLVVDNPDQRMLDLWKQYDHEEWPDYFRQLCEFFPTPPVRVIPINESLDAGTRVMPFDDITKAVDNAYNLAVTKCSCRVVHGECGHPVDVCIQVNKAADYAIERGTGRQIDKTEAVEILKMCSERGLVHNATNHKSVGMIICNCCEDCCENWPGGRRFISPSRFLASVSENKCTLCEECIDRCIFDAISFDQEEGIIHISEDDCMGCGVCKTGCQEEAIKLIEIRPPDHIPN